MEGNAFQMFTCSKKILRAEIKNNFWSLANETKIISFGFLCVLFARSTFAVKPCAFNHSETQVCLKD
jgi:hypothetical protein